MGNVLIKNGLILDGMGREGFAGHVSVEGQKIAAVIPVGTSQGEDIAAKGADTIIDADGLAVAPGFIDCHSHFDWVLPLPHHPDFLFPMVEQGITTVVAGNCGFSPAPVNAKSKNLLSSISETLLDQALPYKWQSMGEFLDYLESDSGLLFNIAQLVGHGAVHLAAVGDHTRRPNADELSTMVQQTTEALDEGAAEKAVRMIEKAKNSGLEVMFDIYPHFCGNSYLTVFLPAWFIENLDKNLENPKAVKRLKLELGLARYLLGFDMADIQIMQAGYPAGEKYNGLNIVEIAKREGTDPVGAMLKIIKESNGKALQLTYGYSGDDSHEQLVENLMRHELCLFETDTILKSSGFANPASYGAFPRILGRFARDKKILGLSEAVSKMSGKTARWMGIGERGEIKPGYFADMVLFNPDTIADNTTIRETDRRPAGIEKVFINGQMVVEDGRYLKDKKTGQALRSV